MIEAAGLSKSYKLGEVKVDALMNVNLSIGKGEYLCIAGASGSGKSTLLNLLGLIDKPTGGCLSFNGKNIADLSDGDLQRFRATRIAFVFQHFNLVPILSAYENIDLPLLLQKIPLQERRLRIDRFTELVGIRDILDHRPDELSGGQQQRVSIARALVTNPEIVLADEPTANLDSTNSEIVLNLMKDLQRDSKTTFVIATHDNSIMTKADKVILLKDGKILTEA